MPPRMQAGSGGIIFHVINRAARRARIFTSAADYRAFEQVLIEAMVHVPIRLLAYVVMPNHFHLVLWPLGDYDLSRFMQWLTGIHAQRWHRAHRSVGTGAVYQGRYRALPVQDDVHLWNVCRYVERNPSRARLVNHATEWRWGSAWRGLVVDPRPTLTEWPFPRPEDWDQSLETYVHGHEEHLREHVRTGMPYGNGAWVDDAVERLGLAGRVRGRGRPPGSAADAPRQHPQSRDRATSVLLPGTIVTAR